MSDGYPVKLRLPADTPMALPERYYRTINGAVIATYTRDELIYSMALGLAALKNQAEAQEEPELGLLVKISELESVLLEEAERGEREPVTV